MKFTLPFARGLSKKIAGLLAVAALGSPLGVFAQISEGGTPPSYSAISRLGAAPRVLMPAVDVQSLLAEDAILANDPTPRPFRFGHEQKVDLGMHNAGTWDLMPDGSKVWRLTIASPGARSINLILNKFVIPDGAMLYLVNRDRTGFQGGFSNRNQQPHLGLGIAPMWTDEVTLEYFQPAGAKFDGKIEVNTVVHGYKGGNDIAAFGTSGACNRNAACPEGNPWRDQQRSVALIVEGGSICTGSMINTADSSGAAYFLTANHCFGNIANWVFWFNWESPTCNQPAADPRNQQTVSGSTLVARNAASDFCLLRLNQRPPASYNVYLNGWNRSIVPSPSGFCFHHPDGDIKKLSTYTAPARAAAYGGSRAGTWRVTWATGTTEGGSSGSPLFDNQGLVIGQLFGGTASCTRQNDPDFYGRFSSSWDSSAVPANQLKVWLDPTSRGNVTVQGAYIKCLPVYRQLPIREGFDVAGLPGEWESRGTVAWATRPQNAYGGTGNSIALRSRATNAAQPVAGISDLLMVSTDFRRISSAELRWDFAHPTDANLLDTLEVLYSTDCGSTFTVLTTRTGADLGTTAGAVGGAYNPTATEWRADSITLPASLEGRRFVQFMFRYRRGATTNNLHLDNITIRGQLLPVAPRAAFSVSAAAGCAPQAFNITDQSAEIPTAYMWYFPGGTPSTSTDVNPTVVYSAAGNYDVTLVVRNAAGMDSLVRRNVFRVLGKDSLLAPFVETFNNPAFPPAGWLLRSNTNSDSTWRWATRLGNTNLPSPCAVINNYTTDNRGSVDYMITPSFNLSGINRPALRVNYAYQQYTAAPDTMQVAYSTDCGNSWNVMWSAAGASLATVTGAPTAAFIPNALTQFKDQLVSIPASLLQLDDVRFAIINRGGFGQFLYVNQFNLDSGVICPNTPTVSGVLDLCVGDTIRLNSSQEPNVTYSWTGPNSFTASTPSISIPVTAVGQGGVYSLTVRAANGVCAAGPVNTTITVNNRPQRPTIRAIANDSIQSSVVAPSYLWYRNGVLVPGITTRSYKPDSSGNYTVIAVNAAGCRSLLSNPFPYLVSLASNILATQTKLWPNPTQGQLVLQLPVALQSRTNIQVLNATGQAVWQQSNISTERLELNLNLPAGLYTMTIQAGENRVAKLFVVQP